MALTAHGLKPEVQRFCGVLTTPRRIKVDSIMSYFGDSCRREADKRRRVRCTACWKRTRPSSGGRGDPRRIAREQHRGDRRPPLERGGRQSRSLDARADAAQPEGPHRRGPDQQARGPVAAKAAHPSPVAQPPLRRQTSNVAAGRGNAARPVLCGGRPVMSIPTAIRWRAGRRSLR